MGLGSGSGLGSKNSSLSSDRFAAVRKGDLNVQQFYYEGDYGDTDTGILDTVCILLYIV
jgi:hypothetical protein